VFMYRVCEIAADCHALFTSCDGGRDWEFVAFYFDAYRAESDAAWWVNQQIMEACCGA